MYKFPIIELVDRYCIAKLKFNKLGTNQAELDFYTEQVKSIDFGSIKDDLEELYQIHAQIWEMEDDFKKCVVEHKYPLDEIGRRAIAVRDINTKRYDIKNRISDKLNDPIKEIKRYG